MCNHKNLISMTQWNNVSCLFSFIETGNGRDTDLFVLVSIHGLVITTSIFKCTGDKIIIDVVIVVTLT